MFESPCQYPAHLIEWHHNQWYLSHVARLRPSSVVLGGSNSDLHVPAESHSNGDKRGYELFYRMKSDVGHVHTFIWVVRVVLLSQMLGNLDDRAVMGYKYAGGYCVRCCRFRHPLLPSSLRRAREAPCESSVGGVVSVGANAANILGVVLVTA